MYGRSFMHTTEDSGDRRNLPVRPVPTTKADMLAQRVSQRSFNIIDQIEQLFLEHAGDEVLLRYLEPWTDDEAVTGKCRYDDFKIAERVQELAEEMQLPAIVAMKTTSVMHKMRYAQKRLNLTREQRIAAAENEMRAQREGRSYGTVS